MDRLFALIRAELWLDAAVQWSLRLLLSILVMLAGLWLARTIRSYVRRVLERHGGDVAVAGFMANLALGTVMLMVTVVALDSIGVPTASLLTAIGAAGLAIGLALRESLGNLASGVLLIVTRPFRAGDFVEAAGRTGTVERIDLLQTLVVTADNCEVTLPNAVVMNSPIVNYTTRPSRRLDLAISIAYEDDIARALKVAAEALANHPVVLPEPSPQMIVTKLGGSGVDLSIRPWARSADYVAASSELLTVLKGALEHAGITIPFPQRVVRVVSTTPDLTPPAATGEKGPPAA